MSTLSERLQIAIKGPPKVTKKALAAARGIKPPSVSDWFSGRTKHIESSNLLAAAKFLKVNPDWLVYGKGEMRPDDKLREKLEENENVETFSTDDDTKKQFMRMIAKAKTDSLDMTTYKLIESILEGDQDHNKKIEILDAFVRQQEGTYNIKKPKKRSESKD